MHIMLLAFWSLFLCDIVALSIITFPVSFARDNMNKGARKIQRNFIIVDTVLGILTIILYKTPYFATSYIDIKIALMLIPIASCVFFALFLYYPSVRFLVKINLDDQNTIDELISRIFSCVYGENEGRNQLLLEFNAFCEEQSEFVRQYGLDVYLNEYNNHADTIVHKPSAELTKYVLERCSQAKYDINHFDPSPFPNIGLILSFVFSTVLTVLLSIITVVS